MMKTVSLLALLLATFSFTASADDAAADKSAEGDKVVTEGEKPAADAKDADKDAKDAKKIKEEKKEENAEEAVKAEDKKEEKKD